MKRIMLAFLVACFVFMTACGAHDTGTLETCEVSETKLSSSASGEETLHFLKEAVTADAPGETTKNDAEDWKAAYIRFLIVWKDENEDLTTISSAKYSFVSMQGIENPVLVLFNGWRSCSFFVFNNGRVSSVQDSEGTDLVVLVDMPVYLWDGCLYFLGASGAPAIHVTNKVSAMNSAVTSETIASAIIASWIGDRDYFYGRDETEITEAEYNAIVNGIKTNGQEIKFYDLCNITEPK